MRTRNVRQKSEHQTKLQLKLQYSTQMVVDTLQNSLHSKPLPVSILEWRVREVSLQGKTLLFFSDMFLDKGSGVELF